MIPGAVLAPMPGFFAPMSAHPGRRCTKGRHWIFEVKWDGVRGLIFIDDGAVTIYTRNNNRCERQYPELQVSAALHRRQTGDSRRRDCRAGRAWGFALRTDPAAIHTQDANAIAKMGQKNPVHLFVFDLSILMGTICGANL